MSTNESALGDLLSLADIQVDGPRPHDLRMHDRRLPGRLLSGGALALGESYMDGWWSSDDLEELTFRLVSAGLEHRIVPLKIIAAAALARISHRESIRGATRNVQHHYDLGNVLFKNMLDSSMAYSCGYWADATTLEDAQAAKLDLICRKLQLAPGMTMLDIGCGWGGLMRHAAREYGVQSVGITLSAEQVALGSEMSKGMPVEIRLQDYRTIGETYDRVVSVGMFEHVGTRHYPDFMSAVERALRPGGVFLLHTIGAPGRKHVNTDAWTERYIFPGGNLPIASEIIATIPDAYRLEDWHNFGRDYTPTLRAWHERFTANWQSISAAGYDERFRRMWEYFLLTAAGAFRARRNELWQIVLSGPEYPGVYRSVR